MPLPRLFGRFRLSSLLWPTAMIVKLMRQSHLMEIPLKSFC